MIAQLVALDLFRFVLPYCSEMIEIWLHPLCCLKISGLREAGSLHPRQRGGQADAGANWLLPRRARA